MPFTAYHNVHPHWLGMSWDATYLYGPYVGSHVWNFMSRTSYVSTNSTEIIMCDIRWHVPISCRLESYSDNIPNTSLFALLVSQIVVSRYKDDRGMHFKE